MSVHHDRPPLGQHALALVTPLQRQRRPIYISVLVVLYVLYYNLFYAINDLYLSIEVVNKQLHSFIHVYCICIIYILCTYVGVYHRRVYTLMFLMSLNFTKKSTRVKCHSTISFILYSYIIFNLSFFIFILVLEVNFKIQKQRSALNRTLDLALAAN